VEERKSWPRTSKLGTMLYQGSGGGPINLVQSGLDIMIQSIHPNKIYRDYRNNQFLGIKNDYMGI